MRPIRYLPVIAVASLLGACASQTSDVNVSEVRALPQMGNDFQRALHRDYVALAQIEIDEAHQHATNYYGTKARQAAANGKVLPTGMGERTIPAANVAELTAARANLMRVLDAGGATRATEPTARAQTQFDCWMEEQEEDFQPKDIALCRGGFLSALDQASGIVFAEIKPMPQPKVAEIPAPAPTPSPTLEVAAFTVYFDHNSSALDSKAWAINGDIAARIKETQATSVTVNGYTDRSGDREYNRLLAERRAATVADALEATGITPKIGAQSYGEDRSAMETSDDVRESLNRRVVITLRK